MHSSGTIDSVIFQIAQALGTLPEQDFSVREIMESFIDTDEITATPYLHMGMYVFDPVCANNIEAVEAASNLFRALAEQHRPEDEPVQYGIARTSLEDRTVNAAYVLRSDDQFAVGPDLAHLESYNTSMWEDPKEWTLYKGREVLEWKDEVDMEQIFRKLTTNDDGTPKDELTINKAGLTKSHTKKHTRTHHLAKMFYELLGYVIRHKSHEMPQIGIATIHLPEKKLHIAYEVQAGEIYLKGDGLGDLTPTRSFMWKSTKPWTLYEHKEVLQLRDEILGV